ncbi:MAG: hypothetical protein JOZ05_01245 [Acetobacteraceae bacterium]|nr:hypothetical protein [Acetobacteraceae bacterium]
MTPEKRPQDPRRDGSGLTFQTLEHGGSTPDTMPQAILLTDAHGRHATYIPQEEPLQHRPQDPRQDGADLTFMTLEHGGEYPDDMPQALRVSDPDGNTCTYFPVTVDGRVVDCKFFSLVDDATP